MMADEEGLSMALAMNTDPTTSPYHHSTDHVEQGLHDGATHFPNKRLASEAFAIHEHHQQHYTLSQQEHYYPPPTQDIISPLDVFAQVVAADGHLNKDDVHDAMTRGGHQVFTESASFDYSTPFYQQEPPLPLQQHIVQQQDDAIATTTTHLTTQNAPALDVTKEMMVNEATLPFENVANTSSSSFPSHQEQQQQQHPPLQGPAKETILDERDQKQHQPVKRFKASEGSEEPLPYAQKSSWPAEGVAQVELSASTENIESEVQYAMSESVVEGVAPQAQEESQSGTATSTTTDDPALIAVQLKFCQNLVRNLKRRREITPFLTPVDPVRFNLPTYTTIVKNPMDIGTIETKLRTGAYKNASEFKIDVELVFSNCLLFNGIENPISLMAQVLKEAYLKEWQKLPTQVPIKAGPSRSLGGGLSKLPGAERPRRETIAHTHHLSDFQTLAQPGQKLRIDPNDLRFCNGVYRELISKRYFPDNAPFLMPVDPVAMGIPTYFDIIKEPMDLSTIKKKLDASLYQSANEFEKDMRLMFRNCFTFNSPDTDVYKMGLRIQAVFDVKWRERSGVKRLSAGVLPSPFLGSMSKTPLAPYGAAMHQSSAALYDPDSEDEDDKRQVEILQSQLNLLMDQLRTLQDKRKKKLEKRRRPSASRSRPSSAGLPVKSGVDGGAIPPKAAKPKSKPKKVDEEEEVPAAPVEVTYDQKRELSENIGLLSQDQIATVFEIIKENTQINANEGSEEIELDIDSLDSATLWKLYNFVQTHTSGKKAPSSSSLFQTDRDHQEESGGESGDSGSDSE